MKTQLIVSEDAFLRQVLEVAALYGWRKFHHRAARTAHGWRTAIQGEPGWPDVFLCRPPRIVIAELKTMRGRPSSAQNEWLDVLARCPGVDVFLWRPCDWDEIEETLR